MAITGDCASPWTHWSSFADRPQKTHVTAAFRFGYKRLRAAHDEWHPCASQPLSWLKRVYSMTSEQQLTGPLLPICRRNIQMSKSMRIRSGYKMGISIPLPESRVALDVARNLIVFLRRPGGQAQFSVSLSTQASGRKALHDLQVWMAENLNKNLSVDVLARRAAMSPRNFSRVFRKETGITPAKFAERLRVEAARRQLEQTVKAVKEIAASCGFSSSEIMRRTFLSQLQVTPSAYRLRFQRRSPPGTSRS